MGLFFRGFPRFPGSLYANHTKIRPPPGGGFLWSDWSLTHTHLRRTKDSGCAAQTYGIKRTTGAGVVRRTCTTRVVECSATMTQVLESDDSTTRLKSSLGDDSVVYRGFDSRRWLEMTSTRIDDFSRWLGRDDSTTRLKSSLGNDSVVYRDDSVVYAGFDSSRWLDRLPTTMDYDDRVIY